MDENTTEARWQDAVIASGPDTPLSFSLGSADEWFHFDADGQMVDGKHPNAPDSIDQIVILDDPIDPDWTAQEWAIWYAGWRSDNGLDGQATDLSTDLDSETE